MNITSDEHSTPDELFKLLDDEFHFNLDVCASRLNHKCPIYFDLVSDGLKQDWHQSRCFMNPPFSNIPAWLDKAKIESEKGALVVCILPNDSSTRWFHNWIWNNLDHSFRVQVRFPNKRYNFGWNNSSKFAILIAIFGKP